MLLMGLAVLGAFPNAHSQSGRIPQIVQSQKAPEQEFASALSSLEQGSGPALGGGFTCNKNGPVAASCWTNTASPTASLVPSLDTAARPAWINLNLTTPSPPPRNYASMVFDAADGYVLLFGGAGETPGSGHLNDTWRFSAGSWTQLFPSIAPGPREQAQLAYDAADGYVLLFGGGGDGGLSWGDSWQFKAGTWTQLSPPSSPFPRAGASMAYDAADGYVVLFGGSGYNGVIYSGNLADTWEFKAGTWTQLSPATSPSPRSATHMVYDAADGYILLFGGDGAPGDTWQFHAGTWSQLSPSNAPSARGHFSMDYDAADGYVLLFGGGGYLDDTWQYQTGSWTQLSPSSSPPGTADSAMVYDTSDGYFVLFGGYRPTYITWEFRAGNWTTQLSRSSFPLRRQVSSMVYDAADGYVLLFGGYNGITLNDTWQFKAGSWTRISTLSSPSPRYYDSMIYDEADGYILLFGGVNGTILGDSWEFKAGSWIELSPPSSPPSRYGASMVYDAADAYVILFGGYGGTSALGDTWEFKAGTWTQLSTSSTPYARYFASMAYDAADGYALLFGGYPINYLPGTDQGDTWEFKAGSWTQLSTSSSPLGRYYASMVYDAADGYVLLFGGFPQNSNFPTFLDDTWEFKAGTWVLLSPSNSPSPRWTASMAYDGTDGYVLLFGGFDGISMLGDSWKFVPSSLVLTTTTLSCDSPVVTGAPTTCTATVSNTFTGSTVPSGTVSFSLLAGFGSFASSNCTLSTSGSSASCSTDYTSHNAPDSGITETLSASYSGDSSHGPSSGGFNLSVLPRSTTSSLSCLPSSVIVTQATVCTVTVTDVSPGTSAAFEGPLAGHGVAFYTNESGTFSSSYPVQNVCVLVGTDPTASCSVNYTPLDVGTGTHSISTGYSDHSHAASFSNFNLTVTPAPLHPTITTVSCDSPVVLNQASSCTASVADTSATSPTSPAGTVTFSTSFQGSFDSRTCTLAKTNSTSADCNVHFTSVFARIGTANIDAAYTPTDATHSSSSTTSSAGIAVTVRTTSVTISCITPVVQNTPSACTATVLDTSPGQPYNPFGFVFLTSSGAGGTFDSPDCFVQPSGPPGEGRCLTAIDFTPSATGTANISGSYEPGDISSGILGASSTTTPFLITVTLPVVQSTTTVVVCDSPVVVNQASACTATVTDTSSSGATVPTGTLTITSSGTGTIATSPCPLIASGLTISSCTFTYTPTAPGTGTHTITASYSGDSTHDVSQGTFDITVTTPPLHTTSTSVACAPSSVNVGVATTCTAAVTDNSVSPTTPSGTVSFSSGGSGTFTGTPAGTCTLSSGTCSVDFTPSSPTNAIGGPELISGTYNGDSTHATSSGFSFLSVTNPIDTTSTSVTCSPSPVNVGVSTTCTATVTNVSGSTPATPSGTVTFGSTGSGTFTGTPAGTCTLSSGTCSVDYTPSAITNAIGGPQHIMANYGGDSTHYASFGVFDLPVTSPLHATSTSVSCTPNSANVGVASTCTVTVTDTSSSPTTPSGSVTFGSSGLGTFTGTPAGTCTLSSGSCSLDYTPSAVGTGIHTITALYGGDPTHDVSQGTFEVTITASSTLHNTSTTVTCDSLVVVNQPSTCTATVADTNASPTTPTGTVNFSSDSSGEFSNAGACTLSSVTAGSGSCTLTYTPNTVGSGTHTITPSYVGDSTHNPSSGTIPIAVNVRSTSTSISCTPSSVLVNTGTTCTVTVTDTSQGIAITPAGTLTLTTSNRGSFSGSCTLSGTGSSSTCTVTYTPTATGTHTLRANYPGDSSHSSSSGTLQLAVTQKSGQPVTLTFTGFDVDDFENGVGQLQVLVNGHVVVDIPSGLNHLTGSGDYTPYADRWVKFGPFDITSFLVQGQNVVVFKDPLSGHSSQVRNVTIVQGNTILLHVRRVSAVYPGHPTAYTFTNPAPTPKRAGFRTVDVGELGDGLVEASQASRHDAEIYQPG